MSASRTGAESLHGRFTGSMSDWRVKKTLRARGKTKSGEVFKDGGAAASDGLLGAWDPRRDARRLESMV